MYNPTSALEPPVAFEFPFVPYSIQDEFMRALYSVVEAKQIGIFESPTGTGKSLSLLCGILKWQQDHERLVRSELQENIQKLRINISHEERANATSADWLTGQAETIKLKEELAELCGLQALVQRHDEMDASRRRQRLNVGQEKKRRNRKATKIKVSTTPLSGDEEDANVEPEDEFIIKDDELQEEEEETETVANEQYREVQVFYASRTHSQLSQVVNEVKQTVYGQSIRIASLASRQNYCINPTVRALHSATLMNERCLEMQKNNGTKPLATQTDAASGRPTKKCKSQSACRCPANVTNAITELSDSILVDVMDIEETVQEGRHMTACPYYAARQASKSAELIMLPYQMLLHRRTREQSGLRLAGAVVIIDEAHNLIDTISSIYSASVRLDQLQQAHQQLAAYKQRYHSRFSTRNLLQLNQLIFVTKQLCKILTGDGVDCRMIAAHELMMDGQFYNLKLNEILAFCERTRLAQKVHGTAQRYGCSTVVRRPVDAAATPKDYLKQLSEKVNQKKVVQPAAPATTEAEPQPMENQSSVMRPLLAFLECLMEKCEDGRVLLSFERVLKSKSSMKFVLLNPSEHFEDILREARAVSMHRNKLYGSAPVVGAV